MNPDPSLDEVETLRRERAQLQAELDAVQRGRNRRRHRIVVTVLLVLAILTFAAAVPGVWARRTVLDTDRYVATVAPLASDPAVQEYIARTVTTQVFQALDVEQRLSDVLGERNERLVFLAGPITNAVQGFVQEKVQVLVASPAFATFWTNANRFTHAEVLAVLEGEAGALQIQGTKVVLNLLPFVNEGLKTVSGVASELIGRPITFPEVTAQEAPVDAVAKIESALGVDLPDQP